MIVLIGLLVLLCLAGAWTALLLEQKPDQGRGIEPEEEILSQRPWAHVEQGPDSLYPSDPGRKDMNGRTTQGK